MSRIKILAVALVAFALVVTGVGVKEAFAEWGYCQVLGCTAGPGGTCCSQPGGRLLRCQCIYNFYCSWVDGGSTC